MTTTTAQEEADMADTTTTDDGLTPMERWQRDQARAMAVPKIHAFTPDEVRRVMSGERVRYEERGPNSPEDNAVDWLDAGKVEEWSESVEYGPSGKPGVLTAPLPEQDWQRLADEINRGRFLARQAFEEMEGLR